MIDIKWIRENPEKFDNAMEARKLSIRASELITLDEQKRKKIFLIQLVTLMRGMKTVLKMWNLIYNVYYVGIIIIMMVISLHIITKV